MTVEQLAQPGETLAAYVEKLWGGPTRLVPPTSVAVLTSATRVSQNNPRRMQLIIVNQGTGNVYFGFDSAVTTATGILIAPLGGSITLLASEDGEATGYDTYCISAAAGNNVSVWELVRK